jgi:hypothetical protein
MGGIVEEEAITKAGFNTLVAQMAMMEQIKANNAKLDALSSGTTSTTPPESVDNLDKDEPLKKGDPTEENDPEKDEEGAENSPKKGGTSKGHSEIPYPTSYVSGRHIQIPHIANCGPPNPLDTSSFANWQDTMRFHTLRAISPKVTSKYHTKPIAVLRLHLMLLVSPIELWRIIKQGYNPTSSDPDNFLPWELVDMKLSASTLHLTHMCLSKKDKALVRTVTSAKETCDTLMKLFISNDSIQESKYKEANNEARQLCHV